MGRRLMPSLDLSRCNYVSQSMVMRYSWPVHSKGVHNVLSHSTHIQVSHTFTVHTLSWPSPIHYVSLTLTLIETDPLNVLEHCEHHDVQFIGTHIGHILSQRQWHGQRVGMAVIRGVGSAWIEAASWSWYKGGDERRGSPFPCQTLCPLMTSHGAPLLLHHVSQAERPNKQTQWYRLTNKQDKTGRLTSTVK